MEIAEGISSYIHTEPSILFLSVEIWTLAATRNGALAHFLRGFGRFFTQCLHICHINNAWLPRDRDRDREIEIEIEIHRDRNRNRDRDRDRNRNRDSDRDNRDTVRDRDNRDTVRDRDRFWD